MLVSKVPYTAVFKFTSGEEFVCEVQSVEEDVYIITNPLTLGMGDKGVQFMPVSIMSDPKKPYTVPKKLVITGSPNEEIEKKYKATLSPIMVPDKKIIT
jgi:hypothetical protein